MLFLKYWGKKFGPLVKELLNFFTQKIVKKLSNTGLGSEIEIWDTGSGKKTIPDPGSRCQKSTGSRIRITVGMSFLCVLFQIQNCRASCTTDFAVFPADLADCQQACTNFPFEACRADCFSRFANAPDPAIARASCSAACASICSVSSDTVGFQIGVSPGALARPFCPAPKLPVCQLSTGSTAVGRVFKFYSLFVVCNDLLRILISRLF